MDQTEATAKLAEQCKHPLRLLAEFPANIGYAWEVLEERRDGQMTIAVRVQDTIAHDAALRAKVASALEVALRAEHIFGYSVGWGVEFPGAPKYTLWLGTPRMAF